MAGKEILFLYFNAFCWQRPNLKLEGKKGEKPKKSMINGKLLKNGKFLQKIVNWVVEESFSRKREQTLSRFAAQRHYSMGINN